MGDLIAIEEVDISQLQQDTDLYQLLVKCSIDHEIELIVCSDGALIMKCYLCPFNHSLSDTEEEYFRLQKEDL